MIPSKRLNNSILPIIETLPDPTTPGLSGSEINGNEGVLYILQTPILGPHHQMQFSVITRRLNSFMYCYSTLIILLDIIHLFARS